MCCSINAVRYYTVTYDSVHDATRTSADADADPMHRVAPCHAVLRHAAVARRQVDPNTRLDLSRALQDEALRGTAGPRAGRRAGRRCRRGVVEPVRIYCI